MRRILVSALFLGASGLPALADPLQLLPSAFATHERANGGAAVQAQPQPTAGRPRYAEPSQPQFGGGFIELLFGGAARQFVAPRPYQPALPDDRSQAAPTPVTLSMPVLNYAPSAFGNMAHPPVDPKFDRQVVAYRGEEKPGTIVIDTPNRFLYLVEGGGKAMRYGIGVGRPGFTWAGVKTVTAMREWPDWRPPDEMIERRPDLPRYMAGGPVNPTAPARSISARRSTASTARTSPGPSARRSPRAASACATRTSSTSTAASRSAPRWW